MKPNSMSETMMFERPIDDFTATAEPAPVPRARRLAMALLGRAMACLARGRLTIVAPSGETHVHHAPLPGPDAVMRIHRWRTVRRIVTGGDIGFAEAFLDGDWSSPDLTRLIALMADNVAHLDGPMAGCLPVRLWSRLRHLANGNSRGGSRRNIAFHYDLGNDFYRLWLDESMTYSSAVAVRPGETLEMAQQAKLDRIVALLDPGASDHVLEIGCGWGALAARIARDAARVSAITLSSQQLAFARERARREGADQAIFHLVDYRDVTGTFDRIVSIEMLEAVGEEYWPSYFETLKASLAPGGRIVLQAITIREDRFDSYRSGTDFIQRYIFPGGMLPSPAILERQADDAGLALVARETFGQGYADTLAEWRRRFDRAWPEISTLGFDERFRRLWHYYLCYCEAGFRTGTIDVGFYVLEHR